MTNHSPAPPDLDAIRERNDARRQAIIINAATTAAVRDISSLLEHVEHLSSALGRIAGMRPEDAGVSRMDVAEFARAAISTDQSPGAE